MTVFRALFVLFIVLPLVELSVLYRLGVRFGFLETIAVLLLVGFVGASLAKREGLRVLGEWNKSLAEGTVPEDGVLSGVLSLLAALLFILPGVISDVIGLVLLFPPSRRFIAARIRRRFEEDMATGNATFVSFDASAFGQGPQRPGPAGPRGFGRGRTGGEPLRGSDAIIDVEGEDVTSEPTLDPSRTLPRENDDEP
jgi:UPF0716 protein FxsA